MFMAIRFKEYNIETMLDIDIGELSTKVVVSIISIGLEGACFGFAHRTNCFGFNLVIVDNLNPSKFYFCFKLTYKISSIFIIVL
jgi:hypothetical protein